MLFQNRKLMMTACTVPTILAVVAFSLGGAHASETRLNTDTVSFQGQEYHYPPAEAINKSVSKPGTAVARPDKPVKRTPVQAVRRPLTGHYNKPRFNNTPYNNTRYNHTRYNNVRYNNARYNNARPYPDNIRPYPARPPVNRPVPYGRPGPVAGPRPVVGPGFRPGTIPPPYARNAAPYTRNGAPPAPQTMPGYIPPPPRPAGAPPVNPPFAGPGSHSTPGSSSVVILDPDIPKEYADNPYINGTYTSKPPPPINNPNAGRRRGSGPFKNMGFGPFNGNDAPWETWPFGSKDSFWSRKEVPFKSVKPADWFKPDDPREGLAIMWDDLIAAPDDLGTMPGGWNVPSVRVPNPVDFEDQLEKASKEVPDLIRVYE